MSFKKIVLILTLLLLSFTMVSAIEYSVTTGDSLFVRGVNWQKLNSSDSYMAFLTVDLAYKNYMNPLNKYASVVQYNWNNWWDSSFSFSSWDNGIVGASFNNSENETYNHVLLNYYFELGNIESSTIECVGGYYWIDNTRLECDKDVFVPQIGYYGLPFYIQSVEFYCDINDKSKGYLPITVPSNYEDTFDLTRPSYQGISGPSIVIDTDNAPPIGFYTFGQMVRLPPGTSQSCVRMSTTNNSRLNIVLRPNPYYRHTNPLTTGSDEWSYSDIINLGTNLTNNDDLGLTMNIYFNYSGNWYNYNLSYEQYNDIMGYVSEGADYNDMDCVIDTTVTSNWFESAFNSYFATLSSIVDGQTGFDKYKVHVKYSELPSDMKSYINTGEGVECSYQTPRQDRYNNLNIEGGVSGGDIVNQMAVVRQEEISKQLDTLDKKLENKRFFAKQIIPFCVLIVIMMFYIFEIGILAFVLFGLIPIMFKQFLKGIKESFDISDLKRVRR